MSRKYLTRRDVAKGLGAAGLAGLAGCSTGDDGDGADPTTTDNGGMDTTEPGGDETTTEGGGDTTTAEEVDFSVGMVYTSAGLGDEGFNDSAQNGLQRAVDDFGIEISEAEPDSSEQYSTFLTEFAQQGYDLVCALSFEMVSATNSVAEQFPDTNFALVDATSDLDNVASYVYREQEGSYLVGTAAGMLSQRNYSAGGGSTQSAQHVGFVGGMRNPVIEKFHAGYEAGINQFDADFEFDVAYAGSWTDVQGGKNIADSMYNDGADIVYPAAGGTGLGVFQSAQEQGRFTFGVDQEQSITVPDYANVILGSMVKRVGNTYYTAIEQALNDNFPAGEVFSLGLEEEGVDLSWGDQLGSEIPQDVQDEVSSQRQGIIEGDIDVPATTYDN